MLDKTLYHAHLGKRKLNPCADLQRALLNINHCKHQEVYTVSQAIKGRKGKVTPKWAQKTERALKSTYRQQEEE